MCSFQSTACRPTSATLVRTNRPYRPSRFQSTACRPTSATDTRRPSSRVNRRFQSTACRPTSATKQTSFPKNGIGVIVSINGVQADICNPTEHSQIMNGTSHFNQRRAGRHLQPHVALCLWLLVADFNQRRAGRHLQHSRIRLEARPQLVSINGVQTDICNFKESASGPCWLCRHATIHRVRRPRPFIYTCAQAMAQQGMLPLRS